MKRMIITLFTFAFALHLLPARAETYNLIGQRYLRLYTAPEPTQAYNASIDAQTVADSLCNVKWTRAISSEATSTTHANDQLDSNVSNRDRFDAALFCALHMNGMHTAYANAAVYRYRFPDGVLPRLTRLSAKVSSDPYNALGARIVLYTNATGEIPTDCATCRGDVTGGIKLAGVAPRVTRKVDGKDYWYPSTTNVVFSQSVQLQQYLFVFVLMENYASSRGNWLEGCSWMDNLVSVTTDAPIPGWTDGQTVDLSGETEDAPADAGIRADSDNDGLTDFRERMASTVLTNLYGTTPVDASKMTTYQGQLVPDYFLPVENGSSGNWTYLGSLLTDHDFVEDWLEDSDELFSGDRRSSRYRHDAREDYDGNGWDNWSEARAFLSHDSYCGHPTPTGRIKVVYSGEKYRTSLGDVVVQAYRYRNGKASSLLQPDATWTMPMTGVNDWYELSTPASGFVCGGKNVFAVFNDVNRDGVWTAGEPYGVLDAVDVGYASIPDSVVEVTDCNPSMMRIDLTKALAVTNFAAQAALNDRGVNGFNSEANISVGQGAYANLLDTTTRVRVRLVRYQVNRQSSFYNAANRKTYYVGELLMDKYVYASSAGPLTEAVLLEQGIPDLDWETGLPNLCYYQNIKFSELASIAYAILVGEESWTPEMTPSSCGGLPTVFVNAFEVGDEQTKAAPLSVSFEDEVCRPTFRWRHEQARKSYPAFRLRIWDGATAVYDSGVQRAPMCDADGVYRWTAPAYVDNQLENGKTYEFSVSMLDAKYMTPNASETKMSFLAESNGGGGDISDQYSIFAAVKYFGHVSTDGKTIRVEAFESPDFVGLPASTTSVTNNSSLATTDALEPNALLIGLEAGRNYFVRAFLDSDGDGILDDGEQWGYCNYVGTNRRDIYTPRPFSFKKGETDMPKAVVYLEDVDVDPLDLSTVATGE